MAIIFFMYLFLLIDCCALRPLEAVTHVISLRLPAVIDAAIFEQSLPSSGSPLHSIACSVDARYAPEQVLSVLGLVVGQPLTAKMLARGLDQIAKQERFTEVAVSFEQKDDSSVVLVLIFTTGLVVDRVSVSGALIGKQRYRQAYLLHAGELFDAERHKAGIMRVESLLHDEGYWGACVTARLKEDSAMRTVAIQLEIFLGLRYTVRALTVEVSMAHDSAKSSLPIDDQRMMRRVKRHLERALLHYRYDRKVLNREVQQVTQLLADDGYLSAAFQLDERIKHDSGSVDLRFILKLGAKNIFTFHGNRHFSRKELLARILLFGSSTTLIPAILLADELRDLYREHGFWQIDIAWKEDGVRTFFFISEGQRAKIRAIELRGVVQLDGHDMVKSLGKNILHERFFHHKHVLEFLSSIVQRYYENGFWDAKIASYDYSSLGGDEYSLVVHIEEGAQRWLSDIQLDRSCPGVRSHGALKDSNVPFDVGIIQKQRMVIMQDLRSQGRMYAQPTPDLIDTGSSAMCVRWRCDHWSDVIHIGDAIVQGNGRINERIIMRELLFHPGDPWDADAIAESVARLKNLNIFESVSITPDNVTIPELQKSVIVQCIPDAPHELRTRFGAQGVNRNIIQWNGGASPKVGLSYIAKNPAGNGDLFRADFDYARYMHDLALSYRIPWIGDHRVGVEIQCVSARYDQPLYIGSPQVLYRTSYDGITLSSGRTYGVLSGGVSGTVVRMGLRAAPCGSCGGVVCARQDMVAHALKVDPLFFVTRPWYLLAEVTGMCDTRDDKINPHRGALTLLALQSIVPPAVRGGSFIKLLLEHAFFCSAGDIVLGLRLRVGAICGADFKRVMPPERFYIGGSHSLRSYEADYAPPLNSFTTCSSVQCVVPTGGKYMMNGSIELRFPLYSSLGGVCFVDTGMLSGEILPVTVLPHHMMGAIGFGLRFNTVIGPLRFDIGWKLKRDATATGVPVHDRRYAWFMTLGHAF